MTSLRDVPPSNPVVVVVDRNIPAVESLSLENYLQNSVPGLVVVVVGRCGKVIRHITNPQQSTTNTTEPTTANNLQRTISNPSISNDTTHTTANHARA